MDYQPPGPELAKPRSVIRSTILLMLDQEPTHGYELLQRMVPFGHNPKNPGTVYRALRWLEDRELVVPAWDASDYGPARRVYTLTAAGRGVIEMDAAAMKVGAKKAGNAFGDYVVKRLKVAAEGSRPYRLSVTATVTVHAADEMAARRKLTRVLTSGQHWREADTEPATVVKLRLLP